MLSPLIGVGEEEPAGDTEVKRHAGVCVCLCVNVCKHFHVQAEINYLEAWRWSR